MSSTAAWQDFKEQVRTSTDLVALISETVTLQPVRGGQEYVGICPFHDDHRPSMRVYTDRQSFKCWACSKGGDCFQFVMLRERVGFREALELLATRAHLELPKSLPGQHTTQTGGEVSKPRLYEILAWAENQFHQFLWESPGATEARDYLLKERQLTLETQQRFKLGFHPENWEWLLDRARGKYTPAELVAAKLVFERDDQRGYSDEFVGRVMFPIHDPQGKTVAFGGRLLPSQEQVKQGKYKNSRDSLLFSKSRIIFGLDKAREQIVSQGMAIVMEGYMDCIAAHQAGVSHAVATMGTALTDQQVDTLKRLTNKVVLVYDGDTAGMEATERALPRLLSKELDLRILTLPEGKDPDEIFLGGQTEWFLEQIAHAPEVWEYKLQRVIARHGTASVDASQRVLEEMLETLSQVPATLGNMPTGKWQMREDILSARLAQQLGLSERNVRDRLNDLRKKPGLQARPAVQTSNNTDKSNLDKELKRLYQHPTAADLGEAELLQLLLSYPELFPELQRQVVMGDFLVPHLRQLWEVCLEVESSGGQPNFHTVRGAIEDPTLQNLLVWLEEMAHRKQIGPQLLSVTLAGFRRRREENELKRWQDGAGPSPKTPHSGSLDSKTLLKRATEFHQKRMTDGNTGPA